MLVDFSTFNQFHDNPPPDMPLKQRVMNAADFGQHTAAEFRQPIRPLFDHEAVLHLLHATHHETQHITERVGGRTESDAHLPPVVRCIRPHTLLPSVL